MGATLEITRVIADSYYSAIRRLQDQEISDDPYSGDFNTCGDYSNRTNKHENAQDFFDWVEEYGEKREAYFYRIDGNRWYVSGWCAC